MSAQEDIADEAAPLEAPLESQIADSWGYSVSADLERSRRAAWIVASVAAAIAFALAIALVFLLPLKTVEPYTLLVDRQTGHVETLSPLDAQVIMPDAALTRSFLVQYVIARESFDVDGLPDDYRKVSLLSAGDARQYYIRQMQPGAPGNPFAHLPRRTIRSVAIRSVSSLGGNRSLVRFTTRDRAPGGSEGTPQYWAAVINYQFSAAEMSAEDRLINPLGFQVTRYRKDPETVAIEKLAAPTAAPVPPNEGLQP